MERARIFVAVKNEAVAFVRQTLSEYDLIIAVDMAHARALLLQGDIDLFLVGILFDDSMAMELIKLIRLSPLHGEVTIVATRLMPSQHGQMLRHVMSTMIALKVVEDFVEIDYSLPQAKEKLCALVESGLARKKVSK